MTSMDTALSIQGLTKRFGGLTAVDNIDIQFPRGILNAVIGPNGAGKTTLFNLVTGMVPASSGRVVFEGNDLIGKAPHEIVWRGLSRTLQIKSVFGGMSVMDNIRIAVFAHEGISNPFRPTRGYRAANDRVEQILGETGLDRLASLNAGTLSYGDVALLEIALALANKPRLLLLDEPICGMSPSETERTVERIVALAKTTDIILIEHDMEVVFAIADLITVMAQGQVLMQGTPNEVAGDSRVQEIYLGAPEDAE
jgi:branched-chain amino acid transport system ATP-binding protein